MNCASFFIKKIALKIPLSSAIFKLPFDFHFFRYNEQNRSLIIEVFLGRWELRASRRESGGVRGWIGRYEIKKEQLYIRIALYKKAATYSPTTSVVPSALKGLTALFGMVRGETFDYNHLKSF